MFQPELKRHGPEPIQPAGRPPATPRTRDRSPDPCQERQTDRVRQEHSGLRQVPQGRSQGGEAERPAENAKQIWQIQVIVLLRSVSREKVTIRIPFPRYRRVSVFPKNRTCEGTPSPGPVGGHGSVRWLKNGLKDYFLNFGITLAWCVQGKQKQDDKSSHISQLLSLQSHFKNWTF